ncbi:hypothetical protein DUI87_13445 [Hirundo rustica rustica]|uniref:Endonuclease/exonuclease/phosphatase domain-containing protein n=1 Tax=Hirundo rustica rustica TaxID=333673 RepID=A0A3M0K919_HIRRU|nr:hypothetical protein DUI87_13445 [Hirundo rustica rustica]
MTHIAGALHWMSASSSEEAGKGEEEEGWVALYIREAFDAMGIETNEDGVECLWIRIKGKANKADILVGVCYHPPNQEEEVDNLFYKQLENVSRSPALVLVGDFNLPDICWELNTAEKRQSRTFLACENVLSQLVSEPTRGGTMLDKLFANRGGLVGDAVVGGHLEHSDHEIIEFSIFGEMRRNINKTFTLDFQRADFGLFRRLIQRVPWEADLKNKGVQESHIYQQSWLTGEVPDDWKLAKVTSIRKKGMKEDPGSYRPVSLISVPSKVTLLVDVGKAVDVVYLDFSKAFDTVSHCILLEKLAAHGFDRSTLCWVKNCLDGQAQRVVVNGAASS